VAASDHLGGQFFHATSAKFKRGDMIVPTSDARHPKHAEYAEYADEHGHAPVFVARNAEFAENYGRYVYQVQPTGETHPDHRWGADSRFTHSPVRVVGLHKNRGY
jgi:hypothetical protein